MQILEWRAHGQSYKNIQRSFKERYGWKPPLSYLSAMLKPPTEPTETQANTTTLAKTETPTEIIEKRISDTIKTREQALGMLSRYLQEIDSKNGITFYDKKGNAYESVVAKYNQLRAFIETILKACDSLDKTKKILPEITANTVNIQQNQILFTEQNITDEVWRNVLRPRIKAELCVNCPWYKKGKGDD